MKHKIISTIALLSMLLSATPALAQDVRANVGVRASTTPIKVRAEARTEMKLNIEERRASTTAKITEMRTKMEERKASSTERRVEMQRGLAKKKAEHTARLMAATIERLEKIIARIEARIAKVQASGESTVEAEGFIVEAKTFLSTAKANIALFASLDLSGDKAQENFEQVRNLASETKELIRQAHQSLMKAVRSLKGEANAELKVEN